MNANMLKYLVELAGGEPNPIDSETFFNRFPRDASANELYALKNLGFVSLVSAGNEIKEIGVNKKAIDYVKSVLS